MTSTFLLLPACSGIEGPHPRLRGRRRHRRLAWQGPRRPASVRHRLVAHVRAEIAADRYLTDEKLSIAVERLLADLHRLGD